MQIPSEVCQVLFMSVYNIQHVFIGHVVQCMYVLHSTAEVIAPTESLDTAFQPFKGDGFFFHFSFLIFYQFQQVSDSRPTTSSSSISLDSLDTEDLYTRYKVSS